MRDLNFYVLERTSGPYLDLMYILDKCEKFIHCTINCISKLWISRGGTDRKPGEYNLYTHVYYSNITFNDM